MPMAPEPMTSSDFGIFSGSHGLEIGPDQLLVGLEAGQHARPRAGGDDDVLGGVVAGAERALRRIVGSLDRELARRGDRGRAPDDVDLVLLHEEGDAVGELRGDAARALHDGGRVESDVLGREADSPWRAPCSDKISAERSSALVGMQPQFRQMPPR